MRASCPPLLVVPAELCDWSVRRGRMPSKTSAASKDSGSQSLLQVCYFASNSDHSRRVLVCRLLRDSRSYGQIVNSTISIPEASTGTTRHAQAVIRGMMFAFRSSSRSSI